VNRPVSGNSLIMAAKCPVANGLRGVNGGIFSTGRRFHYATSNGEVRGVAEATRFSLRRLEAAATDSVLRQFANVIQQQLRIVETDLPQRV
jgi:hypothetical protein